MAFLEAFRGILSHTSFKMVWHHSLWDIYLLSFYIVNLSFCVNFVFSKRGKKKERKIKYVYICAKARDKSLQFTKEGKGLRAHSFRLMTLNPFLKSLVKAAFQFMGSPSGMENVICVNQNPPLKKSEVTQKKNLPGFTLWVYFSLLGFSFYLYMTYKVYLIYTYLH